MGTPLSVIFSDIYLYIYMYIYIDIKNGRISLQKEGKFKNNFDQSFTERGKIQEGFRSELNKISKGNPNYKSTDQINTIKNIKKLYYNGRGKNS